MAIPPVQRVQVIDSHTGGEPTRIVIGGGPDLGGGPVAQQLEQFRRHHDKFRSAIVNEPRGSDVMVGALLVKPADESCVAGVIFFNNVGCLWMCGHGTIGLVITLAHIGRIGPGDHRIETAVGVVTATLHPGGDASVTNVESYRHQKSVCVTVPGVGQVSGDVAWGGNWFFLIEDHGQKLELANVERLTEYTRKVRLALRREGVIGADGREIDHIELFGPPSNGKADSRNFVLCPGNAYDRSPCGTGTSAKLACLAADGKLLEGDPWRQESIIGSVFTGRYCRKGGRVVPTITGPAFVNSESTFLLNPEDPFCWGIR